MTSRWRAAGFTQRKPRLPGVYFISQEHRPRECPPRLRDGWDVAEVRFTAGSFGNVYDQREEFAHWRLKTLDGLDMAWHKGMWMKGPLDAFEAVIAGVAADAKGLPQKGNEHG